MLVTIMLGIEKREYILDTKDILEKQMGRPVTPQELSSELAHMKIQPGEMAGIMQKNRSVGGQGIAFYYRDHFRYVMRRHGELIKEMSYRGFSGHKSDFPLNDIYRMYPRLAKSSEKSEWSSGGTWYKSVAKAKRDLAIRWDSGLSRYGTKLVPKWTKREPPKWYSPAEYSQLSDIRFPQEKQMIAKLAAMLEKTAGVGVNIHGYWRDPEPHGYDSDEYDKKNIDLYEYRQSSCVRTTWDKATSRAYKIIGQFALHVPQLNKVYSDFVYGDKPVDIRISKPDFKRKVIPLLDQAIAIDLKKNPREEHQRKISEALKGNQHFAGRKHSEETKRKISEKLKGENNPMYGKTHEIVACPHCGKEGGASSMKRYHFDNCKQKKNE